MKNLFLLIVAVCFSFQAGAQSKSDSLWSLWNDTDNHDTVRLSAMQVISKEVTLYKAPDSAYVLASMQKQLAQEAEHAVYHGEAINTQGISWAVRGRLDSAIIYFERAHEVFQTAGLLGRSAGTLYNIGNVHMKTGEKEKGLTYMQQSLDISIESNNIAAMTRSYHGIGRYYETQGKFNEALSYYQSSLEAQEGIDDKRDELITLVSIAMVHKQRGDQVRAIEILGEVLTRAEALNDEYNMALSLDNIGNLYLRQGERDKAVEFYQRSLDLSVSTQNTEGQIHSLINLGNSSSDSVAIEYQRQALAIATETNDLANQAIVLNNLAGSLAEIGQITEALETSLKGIEIKKEIGYSKGLGSSYVTLGGIYIQMGDLEKAKVVLLQGLEHAKKLGQIRVTRDAALYLYQVNKELNKAVEALQMHELYLSLNDSINREENQRSILKHEFAYEYYRQALTDSLEYSKKEAVMTERSEKQRLGLFAAGGGLLLVLALAFAIYSGKKKSDELLLNILPAETAQELKDKGHSDAQLLDQVTVLFTDFKGFTALSEQVTPKELVADLHVCFSAFDQICEKYGIEKIKTIGDAYMAAGGLPTPNTTHSSDVVSAAMEMRDFVEEGKKRKLDAGLPYFEVRIGVHTGPVVAGIVGVKKFQYDIWGDTVNTASRMESSGEVGKVNISEATYELLKDDTSTSLSTGPQFSFESRGKIEAKGKGKMEMYFVERT